MKKLPYIIGAIIGFGITSLVFKDTETLILIIPYALGVYIEDIKNVIFKDKSCTSE